MGKIIRESAAELRLLPLMLAKLMGGLMAAVGFPAAIFVGTRMERPFFALLPYLLVGIGGTIVFCISSRAMIKRIGTGGVRDPAARDRRPISILSWGILVAVAVFFLLFTFIMTR